MAGDLPAVERAVLLGPGAQRRVTHRFGGLGISTERLPVAGTPHEVDLDQLVELELDELVGPIDITTDRLAQLGLDALKLRRSREFRELKRNRVRDGEPWTDLHDEEHTAPPQRGASAPPPSAAAPIPRDTSDQLNGTVAVGILLVEGTTAASQFSEADEVKIMAEVQNGLSWLALQQLDDPIEWVYHYEKVQLDVESVSGTNELLRLTLPQLGIATPDPADDPDGQRLLDASYAYANGLRSRLGTDHASYSIWVKWPGRPNATPLGNPRITMWDYPSISGWGADSADRVFAHEMAHVFEAPDEYGGCGSCGGAYGIYGVANGNCVDCNPKPEPCLMRNNTWAMCSWTPAHLGWDDPSLFPTEPLAVDQSGAIYYAQPSGHLHYYRHLGVDDGDNDWGNSGRASLIGGTGWGDYLRILSGGDGVLYAIARNGELHWYRHLGVTTGDDTWAEQVGNGDRRVVIGGTGWASGAFVGAGSDGEFYFVTNGGELHWYRHLGREGGSNTWANGWKATKLGGNGWRQYDLLTVGSDGVIYARTPQGRLHWYRHLGNTSGANLWANGGVAKIVGGRGWGAYTRILAAGNGALYCVRPDGRMDWYRHADPMNGDDRWLDLAAKRIGGAGWGN